MRRDLAALLRQGVEEGVREAADHVLEVAQGNVSVDTGELRDSGSVEASGPRATISFDAEHAVSVHENHRGVSSSPKFLERAMAEERSKIERLVTGAVKRTLGG